MIRDKIKKIMALLNKAYGAPEPLVKDDPVDVLIRTILSQNTSDRNSIPAFYALKERFASWNKVGSAKETRIAKVIRHAGLANIKARRIKGVLGEIMRREGERRAYKGKEGKINLTRLADMDTDDALEYLKSLEGVGPKTASCVLLFGFGRPVMPVDTHIFRVAKRLGLIPEDAGIEEAHGALTKIVPKRLIYAFHLGIIEHGRRACRSQTPKCGVCVVYGLCIFKNKKLYSSRAGLNLPYHRGSHNDKKS